ncbi:MAG TPA: hypothetical protein VGX96_17225 [Candidatus Elarobacter sp.]|jgi:hypothetical protein|nr:hypothetical protein [Candidatus Elarobacter sp.]
MRAIPKRRRAVLLLAATAVLAGCGGGGGVAEPPVRQANLSTNTLQLAVGVATFPDGSQGLNVVSTFRQPGGLSATLVNTPTISGPFTNPAPASTSCPGSSFIAGLIGRAYLAGFAQYSGAFSVAGAAGTDAGTHTISGSPQVAPANPVACTSLGEGGGVFAYGLSLQNQTPDQTLNVGPAYWYPQPLFAPRLQSPVRYVGGPPAYPNVRTGTYPAGFVGYPQGFLTFAIGAPPAGSYSLNVLVPAANAASATFNASAAIAAPAGLPPFAAPPSVTEDPAAGGGLTVSFVAPAGVTESIVDIVDIGPNAAGSGSNPAAPVFYTLVARGSGAQVVTLPPNLGPVAPNGSASPSILPGDNYVVSVIGADYPLFEAGPPANTAATPTISGANGQADLTFAPPNGNFSVAGYSSRTRSPLSRGTK